MVAEHISATRILGVGLGGALQQLLNQGSRPQIRVSGFSSQEVAFAIKRAGLDRDSESKNKALILISGEPDLGLLGLVEESCFTSSGRTATYGRNHNEHGFVYFQLKQESDSQSTRAMYLLRDSDFFEEERWLHLLPPLSPSHTGEIPDELKNALKSFVAAFGESRRLQLRPFGHFLERVGRAWVQQGHGALSKSQVVEIINDALPGMQLFRYKQLSRELMEGNSSAAARLMRKLVMGSKLLRSSGGELDREKLVSRLHTVSLDPANETRDKQLKEAASDFILGEDTRALEVLDFEDFGLCIGAGSARNKKLGVSIAEELERAGKDLELDAFRKLEIEEPLNEREEGAARDLIRSVVFDCLPSDLQKQVRRLIPKQDSFEDVMLGLLKTMDEIAGDQVSHLSITLDPNGSQPLQRLFGLLYGPGLRALAAELQQQVHIALCPSILEPIIEREVEHQDPDDENPQVEEARELSITVSATSGASTESTTFKWTPEDAGIWLLWTRCLSDKDFLDTPALRLLKDELSSALTPASLSAFASPSMRLNERWREHRQRHLQILGRVGLESQRVHALCNDWLSELHSLLSDAQNLESLTAFVAGDCVVIGEGERLRLDTSTVWMLGTHPLRLRWFVEWRDQICQHIKQVLCNESPNGAQMNYLREKMESWSAHRYPPVLSIHLGSAHLPVEERGGCERYMPVQTSSETGDVVDPQAVRALVAVGREYLQTYPYKRDGLHVLFRLGQDGSLVREFVRQFVRREPDARLVLHVVTDSSSRAVASLINAYDNEALLHGSQHSHFPQLEVRHYPDEGLEDWLPESFSEGKVIDLAVIPFLFSGRATIRLADDRAAASANARANPVYFRPQHADRSQQGLSINLRPGARDELLDYWGNAVARIFNRQAIGGAESIHYLRLYSDMDTTGHNFARYLSVAQQVVTIDVGVRRSQLMALSRKPQVAHVVTGLGKNGDYSLVLASDHVMKSLEGRLGELLQQHFSATPEEQRTKVVRNIQENLDTLGSSLALLASARSAHAAELLGRWALVQWTNQRHPPEGDVWWVNLDDHDNWFSSRHADLLRVCIQRDEGNDRKPVLSILACESKLSPQGGALLATVTELRATLNVLHAILPKVGAAHREGERPDNGVWNDALASAIDDASSRKPGLDPDVRDNIMKGCFRVKELHGVGLIWRMDGDEAIRPENIGEGLEVYSLTNQAMGELLRLGDG